MSPEWRKWCLRTFGAATLLCAAALVIMPFVVDRVGSWIGDGSFDYTQDERYVRFKSYVDQGTLIGKSYEELVGLLGPPQKRHDPRSMATYEWEVGNYPGLFDNRVCLEVVMKNDRVSKTFLFGYD